MAFRAVPRDLAVSVNDGSVHFRLPGYAADEVLRELNGAGVISREICLASCVSRGPGGNGSPGRSYDVRLPPPQAETLAVVLDDLIGPLERSETGVKGQRRKSLLRSLRAALANVEEALT